MRVFVFQPLPFQQKYQSFVGNVNLFKSFHNKMSEILDVIYDRTRVMNPFIWNGGTTITSADMVSGTLTVPYYTDSGTSLTVPVQQFHQSSYYGGVNGRTS